MEKENEALKGGTIPLTLRVWNWRLGRESEDWEDFGESKNIIDVGGGGIASDAGRNEERAVGFLERCVR